MNQIFVAFFIFFGVHNGASFHFSISPNMLSIPVLKLIFDFHLSSRFILLIFADEHLGSPGLSGIKTFFPPTKFERWFIENCQMKIIGIIQNAQPHDISSHTINRNAHYVIEINGGTIQKLSE